MSSSFLSAVSERSAALFDMANEFSRNPSKDASSRHVCGIGCGCGHNHQHSQHGHSQHNHSQHGLDSKVSANIATQNLLTDILSSLSRTTSFSDSFSDSFGARLITDIVGAYKTSAAAFLANRSVFNEMVGVPDGAAAFATVARNGTRINNGIYNGRNFSTSQQLRWTRSDGKSDGRGATVVTFAFDDDFGIDGISTNRAKELFTEALQTWARYAPIDFQEIEDPGAGNQVDIYAQSEEIDGRSGTLAFAYFPSVGDITFDTGEVWNESMFLETTVHELGHSLGLDHEDDTDAIMNSVLGNEFFNRDAFLFQDDINGIRSLYGEGRGSVTRLEGTVTSEDPIEQLPEDSSATVLPAINLVTNGSFEEVPLEVGQSNVYTEVKGWSTISGAGFQVDRRPDSGGEAADGTAWVELDTFGQNSTIGQNIDTVTGQNYTVSVDFSDGGRDERTTSVQVFWEGKRIDTLSGGGKGKWRRFEYELKGGDRNVSTLAFRAIGPSDNVGGFIDNIVVTEARAAAATNRSDSSSQKMLGISPQPEVYQDPISGDRNNLTVEASLFDSHNPSNQSTFV